MRRKAAVCTILVSILLSLSFIGCSQLGDSSQTEKISTPDDEEIRSALSSFTQSAIDPTTLSKKVIFGYQGWFTCPGDGSNLGWFHWFDSTNDPRELPRSITVDFWPDTSELEEDEWCNTGMKLENGQPFVAYSAYRQATVVRHFQWMEEYGIDGVEVQRFTPLPNDSENYRRFVDQVLENVRVGAETHGRVFYLQFAGAEPGATERFMEDWKYIIDDLKLTQSPNYLHHNGLPMVGIFISPVAEYEPEEARELIRFFQENEDPKYRATVEGGYALTTDSDWQSVHRALDVRSPWLVGCCLNTKDLDSVRDRVIKPGLAMAEIKGHDFMPVVFPGFSWANLMERRQELAEFNQIPRDGGKFFWRQVYNAVSSGADMLYVAMFDEVDEGTAMFKLSPSQADFSERVQLVALDVDGYNLPSDWYLRLGGETGKALRGEIPLTINLPLEIPK